MKIHTIGIGLAAVMLFAGCTSRAPELKVTEQRVIELGDEVSLKPETFLLEMPDADVLEEIQVSSPLMDQTSYSWNGFKETVADLGKDYLGTGTYPVTISLHGKSYSTKIVVRDTTMPEFVSPAAVVTIPQGVQDFDFSTIYRTDDKGTVTLRVEGDYDPDTAGTYPVILIAEDEAGNTNSVEITINVVADNQNIYPYDQFDNEKPYAPENPGNTENKPSSDDQSGNSGHEKEDSDHKKPDENEQGSKDPNACTVSNVPSGAKIYRNFEEMYNAGTAWNHSGSNNHFSYTIIKDDCGNDVYALILSTGGHPQE